MKAISRVFTLIVVTLYVTAVNAEEGLVLYFSFDDVSGKEVKDGSGNENHGTMVGGAKILDGKIGQALALDGASGAIEVPDSDSLDIGENSMTAECWINTKNVGAYRRIVSKGHFGWTKGYLFQLYESSRVAIAISNGVDGGAYCASKKRVNDGEWHHVVGIVDRDKDEYRIFIDGKSEAFDNPINPAWGAAANPKKVGDITNTNRLTVGKYDVSDVEFLEGFVDELRIWNRALTDAEIAQAIDGTIRSVDRRAKLSIIWGRLKSQ